MYRSRPRQPDQVRFRLDPNVLKVRAGRGLTLVELMIALTITSLLSVVLGALTMAVQTAREHTEGLGDANIQADVSFERIKHMVSHTGTYRLADRPTTLGLAVVTRTWSILELPEVLVVWSGGRDGGMAEAGLQTRLPQINELVIYAPSPENPQELQEITAANSLGSIDFRAAGFSQTILSLVDSPNVERTLLSDRIRTSQLSAFSNYSGATVGNVRFELTNSPNDAELAAAVPGTAAWNDLPWSQSIVGSDSGLRQSTLRMEFQIVPRTAEPTSDEVSASAVPYFGSTSYRYVYNP